MWVKVLGGMSYKVKNGGQIGSTWDLEGCSWL